MNDDRTNGDVLFQDNDVTTSLPRDPGVESWQEMVARAQRGREAQGVKEPRVFPFPLGRFPLMRLLPRQGTLSGLVKFSPAVETRLEELRGQELESTSELHWEENAEKVMLQQVLAWMGGHHE